MTTTQLRLVVREETNPSTVGAGRVDVIRKRLSADEVTPANVRFIPPDEEHPDGQMQQTFDGVTWVDAPALDPRHSPIYQFPPRGTPGDTTRCDAAANLAQALHTVIDILIAAPNVISAINSWLAYVVRFIPEIGFIIQILKYIYDLLETLKPYLEDAFTTDVYDGIQCFMYCRMNDSGILDDAALSSLIADICAQYEETVCTVCQAILQTWWSTVGCTNAAAIGSLTGDCTACECCDDACPEVSFSEGEEGFTNETWSGQFYGGSWQAASVPFPAGWSAATADGYNRLGIAGHCDLVCANYVRITGYLYTGASGEVALRIANPDTDEQYAVTYTTILGGDINLVLAWIPTANIHQSNVKVEIGYQGTAGYGCVITGFELFEG